MKKTMISFISLLILTLSAGPATPWSASGSRGGSASGGHGSWSASGAHGGSASGSHYAAAARGAPPAPTGVRPPAVTTEPAAPGALTALMAAPRLEATTMGEPTRPTIRPRP